MKKWMKIIAALFLVGVLGALYVWFYIYNKPHRDYEAADPDRILAAEELFSQFRNDKLLADSLYTGMVIQITGNLNKVESPDSSVIAVFVFDQGMFGDEGIRCIMLPNHFEGLKKLGAGEEVTIKGHCRGYNDTDVIMGKCSIVMDK